MAGKNIVIIIGNLGRDAELKMTQDGTPVVNFSVATSESWKDKQDEWQERVEWHKVVVWRKEWCGEIKKGEQVYVSGHLETRKWQGKDGKDVYTTEIIARDVMRLGPKKTAASYSTPDVPEIPKDDDSDLPF